jgi:hypothetical protein
MWGDNPNKVAISSGLPKGTFDLALLESKVPKPLSPTDYKATQIKLDWGIFNQLI